MYLTDYRPWQMLRCAGNLPGILQEDPGLLGGLHLGMVAPAHPYLTVRL
jgi:hypothetical protein